MFGRGKKVLVVLTAALMMLSAASLAQVTVIKKGKPASAPTTASAKADESTTAPATGPASAPAGVSVTKLAAVSLSGKIMESPPDFSLLEDDSSFMTMRDWLQRLAKARNDDSVKAVALEVRCPSVSWAQAQELSDAVRRLNDKKPVHAYISSIGSKEYLIASAAREVTMEPCGQIMLTGLGGEMMYFKGTLDLLGIRPQMIQIGKFKGAAEPMTNTKPSDEVVEMYKWLMDDLYEQLCKHIADNRNLGVAAVKKAIDEGPFDADDALKLKLVDKLATSSQWRESVSAAFGAENKPIQWTEGYGKKPKPNVDMSNPFALISLLLDGKPAQATREPTIAIIYGEGVIHSGRGGASLFADNSIGAKTIIEAFETARKDEHVKAVVFRIDSPGGSAVASEQMYQAIKKCDAAKPVIVSISHMGASGGYYIALGGRTIIADPAAIVGSIGVISGKLALGGEKGLYEKIGVSTYEMTRGKNAGLMLSRPWNDDEVNVMRKMAQKIYDTFTTRVKESRKDRIKDIEQVAQGRIFTGRQAMEKGMIDKVGGLADAMKAAQVAAGLKDGYFILSLPKPKTLADLISSLSGEDDDEEACLPVGPLGRAELAAVRKMLDNGKSAAGLSYMLRLAGLLGHENVLAAMPFYLDIRD